MTAYLLCIRETPVRDQNELDEYSRKTRQMAPPPGFKPLVIRGEMETLEGKPADAIILLQFPDVEQAKAWYDSPAYQDALPHRVRAAEYRMILVEGL